MRGKWWETRTRCLKVIKQSCRIQSFLIHTHTHIIWSTATVATVKLHTWVCHGLHECMLPVCQCMFVSASCMDDVDRTNRARWELRINIMNNARGSTFYLNAPLIIRTPSSSTLTPDCLDGSLFVQHVSSSVQSSRKALQPESKIKHKLLRLNKLVKVDSRCQNVLGIWGCKQQSQQQQSRQCVSALPVSTFRGRLQ